MLLQKRHAHLTRCTAETSYNSKTWTVYPLCIAPSQAEGKSAAQGVGLTAAEAVAALGAAGDAGSLPAVNPADAELEDARWFHADWLHAALSGAVS